MTTGLLITAQSHDLDPPPKVAGHSVRVSIAGMRGSNGLEVQIGRDMDPKAAAAILRTVALMLEREGPEVLRSPEGFKSGGWMDDEGRLIWWREMFPPDEE